MKEYSIFLDVGDVLYDVLIDRAYLMFNEETGLNRYVFNRVWFGGELIQKLNMGVIDEEILTEIINERIKPFKKQLSRWTVINIWRSVLRKREEVFNFLKDAKSFFKKRWLLTDISEIHFFVIKNDCFDSFDPLFDGITPSYVIGATKPDLKMFQDALTRADVSPEEVIYFDDRPEIVNAARKLGFKAFQYTDLESSKEILSSLIQNSEFLSLIKKN